MPSYLSDVIGSGTDADPFRPALSDHVTDWQAVDGRTDVSQVGQAMIVECEPSDLEHAAIIADARNDLLG